MVVAKDILVPLVLVTATVAASAACSTDEDCQLNGVCVAGSCRCIRSWRGDACQYLNLLPAKRDAGLQQPNGSSWGGSILRTETNGTVYIPDDLHFTAVVPGSFVT